MIVIERGVTMIIITGVMMMMMIMIKMIVDPSVKLGLQKVMKIVRFTPVQIGQMFERRSPYITFTWSILGLGMP